MDVGSLTLPPTEERADAPLHDYIAKQLAEKLKARKVVVWYDVRREFAPFIAEMRGGARTSDEAVPVTVAGIGSAPGRIRRLDVRAARGRGALRLRGCAAECVVVYLPGCERDRRGSVLMELEKAGECYEPQLKRLARNVLRQRYTDGVIDEMLAPERVSYEDLARASSDTSSAEPPSILEVDLPRHIRKRRPARGVARERRARRRNRDQGGDPRAGEAGAFEARPGAS